MPACPQCGKSLAELTRICPYCKADLDLLVDYVRTLRGGLERAEKYTQTGQLDKAVWSYLEVLEVDPDNLQAKQQVAKVATAVCQFDRHSQGRKWLLNLRGEDGDPNLWSLLRTCLLVLVVAAAFCVGILVGASRPGEGTANPKDDGKLGPIKPPDSATGK